MTVTPSLIVTMNFLLRPNTIKDDITKYWFWNQLCCLSHSTIYSRKTSGKIYYRHITVKYSRISSIYLLFIEVSKIVVKNEKYLVWKAVWKIIFLPLMFMEPSQCKHMFLTASSLRVHTGICQYWTMDTRLRHCL